MVAWLLFAPFVNAGHQYENAVTFQWGTFELDVLVVGVNDPVVGAAIHDAISVWQTAIRDHAAPWLAESLVIRVYDPARHVVPPDGFDEDDVNIVFVPAGAMAMSRVNQGDHLRCFVFAPFPLSITQDERYAIAAHEFGHCLGLGHVFEHGVEYHPQFDVMGSAHGRPCPSNLNLLTLEQVYAPLVGLPSVPRITMPSGEYEQYPCPRPV